jgi:hypothetical protein
MEIHLASTNESIIRILSSIKYPYIKTYQCSCCSDPTPFDQYKLYYIKWSNEFHKAKPTIPIKIDTIVSVLIVLHNDIKSWYTEPIVRSLGLGTVLLEHICSLSNQLTITIPYDIYPYYESVYAIRILYKYKFRMVFEDKGEIRLVRGGNDKK